MMSRMAIKSCSQFAPVRPMLDVPVSLQHLPLTVGCAFGLCRVHSIDLGFVKSPAWLPQGTRIGPAAMKLPGALLRSGGSKAPLGQALHKPHPLELSALF